MGVEAARRALRCAGSAPRAVWFTTTTPAYLDKTNATALHAALRLDRATAAYDALGSVRSAIGALRAALTGVAGVEVVPGDGGWYAVLALAGDVDEEALVGALATRAKVRVHPGFFYDFAEEGYLVVSLIVPEDELAQGASALARELGRRFGG